MSRNYDARRLRNDFVYSVDDIMALMKLSRNTVTNWIKQGFKPSDQQVPYVFRGAELRRFLKERDGRNKAVLRVGQFKCLSCKARVFPNPKTLRSPAAQSTAILVIGTCPECTANIQKVVNETNRDRLLECAIHNTSVESLDEGTEVVPARIGTEGTSESRPVYLDNDRIIHKWLQYAGKYDKKTIASHLAAIRDFECMIRGKAFKRVTTEDASRYRDKLKARLEPGALRPMRATTIRHSASFLRSFFKWLCRRKGFECLDQDIPSYFDLPKKFDARELPVAKRSVPTVGEARKMVELMPNATRKDRRDKAIVCIAFLGALRADTIVSLRFEHFDFDASTIAQNGRQSRSKNSKSLMINFFPLPEIFGRTVRDWWQELREIGFGEGDALFPKEADLSDYGRHDQSGAIPAMNSAYAVTSAFKSASARLGKNWTPHSAKHCIGRLGLSFCRTAEEERAWSINMGHKSGEITRKYYQELSDEQVGEIFEVFKRPDYESPDDKELMIRYFNHELDRNTLEFLRAEQLVDARRQRRRVNDNVLEDV